MKPATRSFYEQAVRRAVARIVEALDEALDLEELARRAALSPFHFHRIFRGMVGETPVELHRRLAMERAAWTLHHGDARITAIAFDAGYETHEAFTRAFRDRYGCTPSEFRKATRGAREERARHRFFELASRSGIHFTPPNATPSSIHLITGEPQMQVTIIDRPALRVAAVRHVGAYNAISEAFDRLGKLAGPAGLFGPHTTMIGIFHDDPETVAPSELRSDAGLVVPEGPTIPPGLTDVHLPAGRYATTTHTGPYEGLGDVWSRLMGEWLPHSGERVGDGVSFELYRNTPMDTPKERLITELYVPLR